MDSCNLPVGISCKHLAVEACLKCLLEFKDCAWKLCWWWWPIGYHCSGTLPGGGKKTGKVSQLILCWRSRHTLRDFQAGRFWDGIDAHLPLYKQPRGPGKIVGWSEFGENCLEIVTYLVVFRRHNSNFDWLPRSIWEGRLPLGDWAEILFDARGEFTQWYLWYWFTQCWSRRSQLPQPNLGRVTSMEEVVYTV